MNMKALLLTILMTATTLSGWAQTRINDLRVQNADEPIAVEDSRPVFSWKMESDVTGQHQTAYRINVVRESDGSTVWDSGKVSDGTSTGIRYLGVGLQPEMGYIWNLQVWDKDGNILSESSRFETGIMNPRISAWKGAEWIGSTGLKLDATSQSLFEIRTDFRIIEGNTASLVFGADDFRLKNGFFNGYGVANDRHYIRVEVTTGDNPQVRIYRVGYFPEDKEDVPFITINDETYPQNNLREIIADGDSHTLSVGIEVSNITIHIDGKQLKTTAGTGRRNFWEAAGMTLNKLGSGGNFPSFPNLCSVGFAAEPGTTVEYSDYQILNAGQSLDRVVFDSDRYVIFKGIEGVKVDGDRITVRNSGASDLICWKDPSYGAESMVRTEFEAAKKIKDARLYVSSMGINRFFINGRQVDVDWFTPGNSQFRETMCYMKYDVTDMLREGGNAMGAELAGGWYTGYITFTASNFNFFGDYEALLAKLVITYEDGSKETIVTDKDTWKVYQDGPVRLGSFFQGERYDARKEVEGWTEPGFDDSSWAAAEQIKQRDWIDFDIVARYDEPVRVREILDAKEIMPAHDDHTYIYNMGVNMVGVPEITIPAGWLKEGDQVILTYGEQVYPGMKGDKKEYVQRFGKKGRNVAGHILYETNRAALDADFYTAAGSEAVTIRPSATFRGYQYIQIHIPSHKGALPLENVKGVVLSSSEIPTGKYHAVTSDGKTGDLVNRLFRNIQRSQLGNFLTIPTDCPQRNERMGWTGDAQAYTRTGIYQADVQNFFRQWMVALRADQGIGGDREVPGGIGSTVPTYNKTDDPTFANGSTWAAAVCQVPWQLYNQYGDTQVIKENMETMMNWLNGMAFYKMSDEYPYLSSRTGGLADHLALDNRTPPDLLNNAIYIHMMEVTAIMAEAIGEDEYAQLLRERHAKAKADWNKAYVDPVTGKTRGIKGKTIHTQASYATPLNFNVFNEENIAAAQKWLSVLAADPLSSGPTPEEALAQKDIEEEVTSAFGVLGSGNTSFDFKPYTITTGFSGTPNILPALSRAGASEDAYKMISNTEYASWLYPVSQGATSIWERWNSLDTAFSEPNQNSMNSFNHFALGAVGAWMFEYQLGITSDYANGNAGYRHFILQPMAGGNYVSLEGSYDSNYGRICSSWTADKGVMKSYTCTVPANTSATVYIPVGEAVATALPADGAEFKGFCEHLGHRTACYEVVSGKWNFEIGQADVTVNVR